MANLKGADLSNADLGGASLEGARGLSSEAIERTARSLKDAIMPNGEKHA